MPIKRLAVFCLFLAALIVTPVIAISQYNLSVGSDTVIVFNGTAGSMTWTAPSGVTQVWYLIVGGGGGGGCWNGGGGGAGGVLNGTTTNITSGNSYQIVVGSRGSGSGSAGAKGTNGTSSTFSNITALGGGGGGSDGTKPGFPGGSGGGGAATASGGSGTTGQGYSGGTGYGSSPWYAGGGGGANETGKDGGSGRLGGGGKNITITGSSETYGTGGTGGYQSAGSAISATTPGGGGGGGWYPTTGGAAGNNGTVIIRFSTMQDLVANFTINATSGTAPLAVAVVDTSPGSPIAWNYSVTNVTGNNTPIYFSTSQNPTVTLDVGNWSFALNASNATSYSLSTQVTFVNVTSAGGSAPLAMFTKNLAVVIFPRPIQFNDTSTNTPTAWNWSFGDDKYSNSQNPTHQYVKRGRWSVLLNASNSAGFSTNTSTVWILGG